MPLINPRTSKLKGIIQEMNAPEQLISTSNNPSECPLKETQNINTTKSDESMISPNLDQRARSSRNRKYSNSSSSSSQSGQDFSPATSDSEQEYKPSTSCDDSSASESANQTEKHDISTMIKNSPLKKPCSSRLSSSSKSSGSSNSSDSSSSSSSSSSCSCSETDSDSSNSEKNSVTPAKKQCTTSKSESEILNYNNSNNTISSLLQIPLEYESCSSSKVYDSTVENPSITYDSHMKEKSDSIYNNNDSVENNNYNCELFDTQDKEQQKAQEYHQQSQNLIQEKQVDDITPLQLIRNEDETTFINIDITSQPNSLLQPTFNPLSLKSLALEHCNNILNKISQNNELKTRKRKRGSAKATAKTLRNMGLPYISTLKKKLVPEKKMGNPCGSVCRLKCSMLYTEEQRMQLFNDFWRMGSLSRQRDFISKHMTEIKPKYQYKKEFNNRQPKHAFYLTINNEKKKVCKLFFKRTLGINDRPIRTVIEKTNKHGIVLPELRGKHQNHGRKISNHLIESVKQHIDSIPKIESHYLRKQTTRLFIEGGKTLTDLYNDYKQGCIQNGCDYVKIHTYRNVFKVDYNISFFTPKKDRCEDCVVYENAEPIDKDKIEQKYRAHLQEKDLSREEKEQDKQLIDENNIVACYDLQAMLQVPKGDISSFYYKSRLNCLNFTICELKNDHTDCFFWTEVEGQKGANEIGSCVFKYLEKKSRFSAGNCNIIFYSDNCCGQQKNQFIFSMYIYAVKNLHNIQSITHKFLVKGHTQNEGDSVHSCIERQIKRMLKSGPIYVPGQYISAIQLAKKTGNKYNVIEMSHSEFYNIKNLQEYKLNKNVDGKSVKVGEISILRIEKADTDDNVRVLYKNSYMEPEYKEIKLVNIRGAQPGLVDLYTSKIPLPENKKKDLKDLIKKKAIPHYYASSYYDHIL